MYQQVIEFWFEELEPIQWWQKDDELDVMIQSRFGLLHDKAKAGELYQWREAPLSSLAEIIILDQFSRNIYRDTPASFAQDSMALTLAQFAVAKGFDNALPANQRVFYYLPFMHSESKLMHEKAVALFEAAGNLQSLDFEFKHKTIIDRFGRYPHRNDILGRKSTVEEIEFLQQAHSSF